jgi:hypothetical protein
MRAWFALLGLVQLPSQDWTPPGRGKIQLSLDLKLQRGAHFASRRTRLKW